MEKSKFLALKDLFEHYLACERELDQLARARKMLDSERLVNAGVFSVELGGFRT